MVTLRYRKQQAEDEARKQRLIAARQTAASLSLQQARQYTAQKANQSSQVRRELQTRWALEQQDKARTVTALLQRAEEHRAEGLTDASRLHQALVAAAADEVSAWSAEHQLEQARFRLASAYVIADGMERNASAIDAAARRAKVRAVEGARAAKVAAATASATSLADAAAGMERFDQQPVCGSPFKPIRVNIPRDKRMSSVAYPPRCTPGQLFDAQREDSCAEDGVVGPSAAQAAVNLVRQREREQRETADKVKQAQAAAAERAERVLRDQRAAAEHSKQIEAEERAHRRELAEVYRQPRVSDESGRDGAALDGACPCAAGFPATYRQQAQQAAREAEEAFVRDFVEGPPVLVPGVPSHPFYVDDDGDRHLTGSRQEVPVEYVLRPARVQDLLPQMGPQTALPAVPMAAQPLVISVFASAEHNPTEQAAPPAPRVDYAGATQGPVPVPPPEPQAAPSSSAVARAGSPAGGQWSPSPTERPSIPPVAAIQTQDASVDAAPAPQNVDLSEDDAGPYDVVEVSRVTDPAPASLSGCSSANSSTILDSRRERKDSTCETSEPMSTPRHSDATSPSEASHMDTTFTSTSSSSMRPTMTAEQLKLALIRLRNRMRAVQL